MWRSCCKWPRLPSVSHLWGMTANVTTFTSCSLLLCTLDWVSRQQLDYVKGAMASQIQIIPPRGGCQSQNLWQKALDTLDDNLKASLDFKKSTQRNIVAAVLKTAQEKKRLCLQKRWKYKKANGEEIILRDVVEKIIVWLDKFKAVGDAATQYDSAHASLAWAGVRFLLQVGAGSFCWLL